MGGRGERRLKDNEITNRYYTSHEKRNMMNEAQRTKERSPREGNRSNSVSMQNQARRETGPQGNRNMSSVEREQPESQNSTQVNANKDASLNRRNLYSVSSRRNIEWDRTGRMISQIVTQDDVQCSELDSHTDMCCFRSTALVLSEDLSQCVSVSRFLLSMKMKKEIQVGSVAVAYDDSASYSTYILVFHQVLIVLELERNVLCPFQLHLNGITINENPLQFTQKNGKITEPHSMIIPG